MFPAGGRQPFRLSPRRTPLFSSSPSRTRFGWFFLLIITPAFSRLKIGFTRGLHARLPAARADFYQRVRRLLTGGLLSSAVAQGLWRDKPAFARLVTAKCNEAGSAATASQYFSKTRFSSKKAKRSSSTIGRARYIRFSLLTFFSREKKVRRWAGKR